ncbi:MAG TPA: hypothetical protein VH985_00450 [Candidatus Binatia bacterium]
MAEPNIIAGLSGGLLIGVAAMIAGQCLPGRREQSIIFRMCRLVSHRHIPALVSEAPVIHAYQVLMKRVILDG